MKNEDARLLLPHRRLALARSEQCVALAATFAAPARRPRPPRPSGVAGLGGKASCGGRADEDGARAQAGTRTRVPIRCV